SHEVESVETIERRIKRALEVLQPEQLWIDPDCGLKTRSKEEAVAKLKNMVEAVRRARADIGGR
ncbi:MAG: cobalamin-independent methionine synthase II family protein, partial [Candidatus Hadarchaeum sp.]